MYVNTKAKVLSFADIEDLYKITYVQKQAFVVHIHDRDLVFNRRQKLYIVGWSTMVVVAVTIGKAVHLLTNGNIHKIPTIQPVYIE